ncbi:hypothetical protein [Saccharomonospora sp. CUA-673]|uniref:hypothetical protein n=1 Tax=Saccharomonospora sp. CUA-673 TaxID=1904969 RepID=UPI00096A7981|nr:hypothetical protein [Saccharomonospora sp. CUA-673]
MSSSAACPLCQRSVSSPSRTRAEDSSVATIVGVVGSSVTREPSTMSTPRSLATATSLSTTDCQPPTTHRTAGGLGAKTRVMRSQTKAADRRPVSAS